MEKAVPQRACAQNWALLDTIPGTRVLRLLCGAHGDLGVQPNRLIITYSYPAVSGCLLGSGLFPLGPGGEAEEAGLFLVCLPLRIPCPLAEPEVWKFGGERRCRGNIYSDSRLESSHVGP